ncbi:MAG: Uma2 family endonuclease [Chloroflexota bacterium]
MVAVPARRRLTVDEYYQMAEVGILRPHERVELIDGEIIQMSPIGDRHAAAVDAANAVFSGAVGQRTIVRIQNPVRIDGYNDPQPDLQLLRPRADYYAGRPPRPPDVLLIIEVADSSLMYDRWTKLPIYAQAGIPEAWLVDLTSDALEVHRQPGPQGYSVVRRFRRGERVAPQALPDVMIAVDDLLPVPIQDAEDSEQDTSTDI